MAPRSDEGQGPAQSRAGLTTAAQASGLARVSRSVPTTSPTRGGIAAFSAYLVWGLAPLFWKQLLGINAVELIAHRIVWSLLLLLLVLGAQGRLREVWRALSSPAGLATTSARAALLTGNWLMYVWGVTTGHVVEASLGYFLVPLVNVACGRFILGEHLRRAQAIAIVAAAIGVTWLVVRAGRPPWIALTLAGTWGGYGLMRKQSPVGAVTGLASEVVLIAPLALAFLLVRHHTGAFGHVATGRELLLISTGVITAIPLVCFGYGARRIRLSTLGVLQYITPTVQLALGVWVYGETFSAGRFIGFAFIWAGLILYTFDGILVQRKLPSADVAAARGDAVRDLGGDPARAEQCG